MPLSVQDKDSGLRILSADRRFGEAVNRDPALPIGKTPGDRDVPGEGVARANVLDRTGLVARETAQVEERGVSDRVYRDMMAVKAPILDAASEASHVVAIGADVTELHRLRAEADDVRRQLQLVLDAVPVTIAMKDNQRRYLWVNRAFEQVHGAVAGTVLGRRAEEFAADPAMGQAVARSERALLATGREPPPMPQRFYRPDGHATEWSIRRLPLRDAAGAIDGILVVGVDVTTLRRANDDLEARAIERARELAGAHELVTAVIHAAPMPVVTFRPDGGISGWNPAAETVTGYSAAEALGGLLAPRLPEDQAVFDATLRHLTEGHAIADVEARWIRKDGQVRELLVSGAPLRRPDGSIDGAVAIWQDVTERKKTERELVAARDNLLDAVESIAHAIVLYDCDDRIVLFNSLNVDHNREVSDMIAPGVRYEDRLRAAVERGLIALPDGQTAEQYLVARIRQHRRADGTKLLRRHTDGRVYEVWDNRARGGGIVSMAVEVTERLRLEQQLRQAQKMEAIGQLTGGIAHDFNNLLAVVIGNLDLLLLTLPPDGPERALADQAIEASERGAALTGRLLAFARRQTLRPAPTGVASLVAGMEPLLRRAVGEAIEIESAVAEGLWPALIDPSQLENAILNLAVNARDAMPDGGTLKIQIRNDVVDADAAARWDDLAAGEYVRVDVSDNGTGIPADVLEQVFEPFFSTKETGKGSGLGLSMVFGFVRQSGGYVHIYSEMGRGTSVVLFLPRAEAATEPVAREHPVVRGMGETILLVEDNATLRQTAANMVAALGYRVLTAEDGAAALAVVVEHPGVDLLFSDVILPGGMNGFDLARELGRRGNTMAVLYTSGFADPAMVTRDRPNDGATILTKPYRRGELAEALRAGLARRPSHPAA